MFSGKRRMAIIACILCALLIAAFPGCGRRKDPSVDTPEPEESGQTAKPSPTATKAVEEPTDKNNGDPDGGTDAEEVFEPHPGKQFAKPDFTGGKTREYSLPIYDSRAVTAQVRPYRVNADLSNIENLDQFGEFTDEQKKKLAENGFFVASGKQEQLFYIYEDNTYRMLPGFISTDSVLQVYHIFFDYSLRTLEVQTLLGSLETLTQDMLDKSIYLYGSIGNPDVKALALRNAAYFAVAQAVLGKPLPESMPEGVLELALAEKELVYAAAGFAKSPLMGYDMDYSQYKPRGHYTRSEDLERYFRAMMWYGQVPFNLLRETGGKIELDKEPAVQALIMTYALYMEGGDTSDIELWENIYDPTVFYVGEADDLTIYEIKDLLVRVYGKDPDLNTLLDDDKLGTLLIEARKLPEPRIQPEWATVNAPVGRQFRFMGQRYIPDSEILQRLVEAPMRVMPSGLDVMGVLGSDRAYDISINVYEADKDWADYPTEFARLKEEFSSLPEATWQSNMYYGWLWTLKALLRPFGEGYPSFMTNEAWEDKSLSTALASWSELRHDTILYGKQSVAEGGGGDPPPHVLGYVEPNVELYRKLLWLTQYSRENLKLRNILPETMEYKMEVFENLLSFLAECSIKELRNEMLSEEEYIDILHYGQTLEYLTSSLAEEGMRWFEITSDADKNMAVIADVHTAPGAYLEEGVGEAAEMFVVVPIDGKLYLTRGAAFDYYEFVSDTRLTDEEWQQMLKKGTQPPQPEWVKSFKEGVKAEIPEPAVPYYPW